MYKCLIFSEQLVIHIYGFYTHYVSFFICTSFFMTVEYICHNVLNCVFRTPSLLRACVSKGVVITAVFPSESSIGCKCGKRLF